MVPEVRGYYLELLDGWQLTVSTLGEETVAWLTNDGVDTGFYEIALPCHELIDLETLGYVPSVYWERIDAPPLVLFHAPRPGVPPYVLEPASGRFYRAGEGAHA
jgi:hypothetical protein